MGNHVRRQIREAVTAALMGGTAGANVFAARTLPLARDLLPALLVATDEERVDVASIHSPQLLERRLTVTVRGVAKAANDVDDVLDALLKDTETALAGNTLGGLCKGLYLTSVSVQLDGSTDADVGIVEAAFSADFFTAGNAPDVSL